MPHIHEQIDFTVEVFIVHANKVLLRKHDKYGIWLSIGGHIELDEDPVEAALREVKEEVGLTASLVGTPPPHFKERKGYKELMSPRYITRHPIGDAGHEHVVFSYFATSDSDMVVPEKETDEWRWFTKEELQAEGETLGIGEDIMFYASTALDELST
ncbi:MAG: NUDIX domain-containing protein [Candidatus Pacebacteria bacterium]|nr:NUDIX domain-containing protein [Candidatus Paceibacterota bacterium]